jgi:hypothetical protein
VFLPITETAFINVKQQLRGDQWYIFFDQSDVLVEILVRDFESHVLLGTNDRSTDQIRMFLQKGNHPLIAQTFLEVRLDKTENASLGNVIPWAVAVFNESCDCGCLIFIECGGPIGRFRPLFGFRTYFSDWDGLIPNI